MKLVRVVAALNSAAVACVMVILGTVILGGCAGYSIRPASGSLTSFTQTSFTDDPAGSRRSGVVLDGVVTGVEVDAVKGGSASGVLGVGASTPYWRVAAAVEVRAANARTGAILRTVSARDVIYVIELGEGGAVYTAPDAGRQARTLHSLDEAQDIASRRAIRKAARKLTTLRRVRPHHTARHAPEGHHKAAASKGKTRAAPAASGAIPWLSRMQAFGLAH
jgi:hypothetical protein